jgi:drug/metabolite transporter (DMT)-like permease
MLLLLSTWTKGIALSIMATIIGGASKLAIRKSWILELSLQEQEPLSLFALEQPEGSETENRERESQALDESLGMRVRKKALCLRLMGMLGMTLLNPLCGVLAMRYASPSITAPFSGLTLVWIIVFSETFVGEAPSKSQIYAAGFILFGEVITALFGDHTNDQGKTIQEVVMSYKEPVFLSYLLGVTLWLVLLTTFIRSSPNETIKRFAWGASGGSMTGIQNFMKDSLTILQSHEEIPWFFPIMLLMAIIIAFGGLQFLSGCMKRYDVTFSSSMFVGSYVVSASIMSAAHYHTFENLGSKVDYFLYPIGLIMLLFGVYILVKKNDIVHDGINHEDDAVDVRKPAVNCLFYVCFLTISPKANPLIEHDEFSD